MKALHVSIRSLFLACLIFLVGPVAGQETPETDNSLNGQFEELIAKSSTYEKYKVIPITSINDFWGTVMDSVGRQRLSIDEGVSEIRKLKSKQVELQNRITELESSLAISEELNDTMVFLGVQMGKTAYHILVWSIIVIVFVLAGLAYTMFIGSNKTTSRVKRESEKLRKEFDAHRDKSRETQVRLKRELQTALNSIEEMKRGGNSR